MVNYFIEFSLASIFLSCFLIGCAKAQTIDLSTNEAVLAELQRMTDARNAELYKDDEKLAAKLKAKSKLEAKDICIRRLKDAEIVVIGYFRTDVGCRFDGAFINSRFFEQNDSNLSKAALAELGWEKSSKRDREILAALWVEKALLVFAPLPKQTLSAVSTSDGKIKVTASSKYPPGVTSRNITKIFVFDENGGLASGSDN